MRSGSGEVGPEIFERLIAVKHVSHTSALFNSNNNNNNWKRRKKNTRTMSQFDNKCNNM